MTLLLIYLALALFISFLCSAMEAVLLSTPTSYVQSITNKTSSVKRFLGFKQHLDKPLSAILSLNTIAHTVGAAGVGAQAIVVFGDKYFGLVSAVLTILILVVTEIIPKTLAAQNAKSLISISSSIIQFMIFITYPIVIISSFLTKLISKENADSTTSREEISALAHIGTQEGIFLEKENKIIQNLIRLRHIKVKEIMTPRIVTVVANENMTLKTFLENKAFLHYSRIPIYAETRDQVTGYIFRELAFEKLAEDQFDLQLKDIKRPILMISNSMSLMVAWEELLLNKEHIAIITDEYGGMDGIVTLEDIIETLLGFEILDEKDEIENMQQYATDRWKSRQSKYKFLKKLEE